MLHVSLCLYSLLFSYRSTSTVPSYSPLPLLCPSILIYSVIRPFRQWCLFCERGCALSKGEEKRDTSPSFSSPTAFFISIFSSLLCAWHLSLCYVPTSFCSSVSSTCLLPYHSFVLAMIIHSSLANCMGSHFQSLHHMVTKELGNGW